ncbi:hypothetical protein Aco03nite_033650 [Actinoplanes couchii]|uniref:Uncharacterized protein n=1 Tax=Actinoplanes couchii TaxID=403638 RepID=A0ABQ3X8Y4_9ACTN|nr:hypothetical protein Aco03nite_033650 [Actinoplanes couchii]
MRDPPLTADPALPASYGQPASPFYQLSGTFLSERVRVGAPAAELGPGVAFGADQ